MNIFTATGYSNYFTDQKFFSKLSKLPGKVISLMLVKRRGSSRLMALHCGQFFFDPVNPLQKVMVCFQPFYNSVYCAASGTVTSHAEAVSYRQQPISA